LRDIIILKLKKLKQQLAYFIMNILIKRFLKTKLLSVMVLLCCILAINNNRAYGQFVQVESILVDACDEGTGDEGLNEMVRFRVESLPINVKDIRVDNGTTAINQWPSSGNTFLGWITPSTVAYDTAVAKVGRINNSIVNCGKLIIPTGGTNNQGLIPAGKKGLIITSFNFLPFANDFSTLTDTLYVVFQDNPTNTSGNFTNYGAAGIRTLRLHKVSTNVNEDVEYDKSLLIKQNGTPGAEDGGGVRYTDAGVATYYNDGCQAPYIPLSADWTAPAPMCPTSPVLNLSTLITGNTGGIWSGTGVTGSFFDPTGLNGTYSVTYTVGTSPCIISQAHDIQVNSNITPTFTSLGPYCVNASPGILPTTSVNNITGTWNPATINTTAAGTTTYTFTPAAGQCAVTATMSITVNTLNVEPVFTNPGPFCVGATPGSLVTTSENGITGTWNPATINTGVAGTTEYTFTPAAGQCGVTASMMVTINEYITPIFTALGPYCMGAAPDALPATSTNGITGVWSPSAISTVIPGTTAYTFTAADGQCGVTTVDSVKVNPCVLTIPNVITPNGDEENDVFEIINIEYYANPQLVIFNRWGKKVYESSNYRNEWDGGKLSDGTYYYILTLSDGTSFHGIVTVLR
jgi:gliding motility-associated-like protein